MKADVAVERKGLVKANKLAGGFGEGPPGSAVSAILKVPNSSETPSYKMTGKPVSAKLSTWFFAPAEPTLAGHNEQSLKAWGCPYLAKVAEKVGTAVQNAKCHKRPSDAIHQNIV